jgi:hypothetical protein
MSFAADHESKLAQRACHICHDRKARFRYRGEVRADRQHVLCFACFRSERDRRRARLLLDLDTMPFLRPAAGRNAVLTEGERAHRERMLAHLAGSRRGAAGGQQGR